MASKTFTWPDGSGQKVTVQYSGSGNDVVSISSEVNNSPVERSMTLTFETTTGNVSKQLIVTQSAAELTLTLSPNSIRLNSKGNARLVSVITNAETWAVQSQGEFDDGVAIRAVKSGAGVSIQAPENLAPATRTGTVVISATQDEQTITRNITVTQSGTALYLTASPDEVTIDKLGTEEQVSLSTNGTISNEIVITNFNDGNKPNAVLDDDTLRITAPENTSTSQRTATITLTATYDDESVQETITVIQTASDLTITVSPTTINLTNTGTADSNVTVTTNGEWSIYSQEDFDDGDALTLDTSGNTITVSAPENDKAISRMASFVVRATAGSDNIDRTVTVKQAAAELTLEVSSITTSLTTAGTKKTITVTTNGTSFDAEVQTDFSNGKLYVNKVAGGIEISADANTSPTANAGTILVTAYGEDQTTTKTIIVTQSAAALEVVFDKTTVQMLADGTSDGLSLVSSNAESWSWEVSGGIPDLAVTPASGSATSQAFTVTGGENNSVNQRTGIATFKYQYGSNEKTVAVTVTQAAAEIYGNFTEGVPVELTANGEQQIVQLKTNGLQVTKGSITGNVTGLDCTIVKGDTVNDETTYTLQITASQNLSVNALTGKVEIEITGGSQSLTLELNVTQSAGELTAVLDKTTVQMLADGTSDGLSLTSTNAESWSWEVNGGIPDLEVTPASGSATSQAFTLVGSENTSVNQRTGTATFKYKHGSNEKTIVVTVNQAAAEIYGNFTKGLPVEFGADGNEITVQLKTNGLQVTKGSITGNITGLDCSIVKGSTIGNETSYTLTFTASQNLTADTLTGKVEIIITGGSQSLTLEVDATQSAVPMTEFEPADFEYADFK